MDECYEFEQQVSLTLFQGVQQLVYQHLIHVVPHQHQVTIPQSVVNQLVHVLVHGHSVMLIHHHRHHPIQPMTVPLHVYKLHHIH
jgi:hypothetical protein